MCLHKWVYTLCIKTMYIIEIYMTYITASFMYKAMYKNASKMMYKNANYIIILHSPVKQSCKGISSFYCQVHRTTEGQTG